MNKMNRHRKMWLLIIFAIMMMKSNVGNCEKQWNRDNIVKIAISQIGYGENGKNNCGKDIRTYLKGKENMSWCAGFVNYCIVKSGKNPFNYTLSAKNIYNIGKKNDWIVKNPESGDLVCFWRIKKNGWQGHIGIIEKVENNIITCIEGNVGKYPAKVKRIEYDKNNVPKLLGYVRIK